MSGSIYTKGVTEHSESGLLPSLPAEAKLINDLGHAELKNRFDEFTIRDWDSSVWEHLAKTNPKWVNSTTENLNPTWKSIVIEEPSKTYGPNTSHILQDVPTAENILDPGTFEPRVIMNAARTVDTGWSLQSYPSQLSDAGGGGFRFYHDGGIAAHANAMAARLGPIVAGAKFFKGNNGVETQTEVSANHFIPATFGLSSGGANIAGERSVADLYQHGNGQPNSNLYPNWLLVADDFDVMTNPEGASGIVGDWSSPTGQDYTSTIIEADPRTANALYTGFKWVRQDFFGPTVDTSNLLHANWETGLTVDFDHTFVDPGETPEFSAANVIFHPDNTSTLEMQNDAGNVAGLWDTAANTLGLNPAVTITEDGYNFTPTEDFTLHNQGWWSGLKIKNDGGVATWDIDNVGSFNMLHFFGKCKLLSANTDAANSQWIDNDNLNVSFGNLIETYIQDTATFSSSGSSVTSTGNTIYMPVNTEGWQNPVLGKFGNQNLTNGDFLSNHFFRFDNSALSSITDVANPQVDRWCFTDVNSNRIEGVITYDSAHGAMMTLPDNTSVDMDVIYPYMFRYITSADSRWTEGPIIGFDMDEVWFRLAQQIGNSATPSDNAKSAAKSALANIMRNFVVSAMLENYDTSFTTEQDLNPYVAYMQYDMYTNTSVNQRLMILNMHDNDWTIDHSATIVFRNSQTVSGNGLTDDNEAPVGIPTDVGGGLSWATLHKDWNTTLDSFNTGPSSAYPVALGQMTSRTQDGRTKVWLRTLPEDTPFAELIDPTGTIPT